ncbi:MAG: hypothetical protein FJX76_22755, partial [Armatimonadetes bacterium]|nr:hypothetical protein [Armatimonadota bacterium]
MYACTIFVSAFLLFLVQPMIGKAILPWFGGSAAIWTTCLLFFQLVLPLGYLYAYALVERLSGPAQGKVHLALLAVSLLSIPLQLSPTLKPGGSEEPIGRILMLLLTSVGLPYFLLSTTSPLLQAWYLRTNREGLPYRLFALSNLGSMLALLTYPVLLEPRFSTQVQMRDWSAGYALFVALAAGCAWRALRLPEAPPEAEEESAPPPPRAAQAWLWLALPACASVLLMAITNHMSQDVAAIPFFWVITLALYLLSFI